MSVSKFLCTAFLFLTSLPAIAAGWVEGAHIVNTDLRVWGWACDRAVPSDQVWVHIWRDDAVFLGAALADIPRESAVGQACGGSSQHGFYAKITVPVNILDWKNHSIQVSVMGLSGSERINPSPSIEFSGLANDVSKPKFAGDVVGRDYFGAYVGHLGIWDGSRVYQMTGAKSGQLPTMSSESIDSFNSQSKPWGAVTPRLPFGLRIKRCFSVNCNSSEERRTFMAANAISARAFQIYLIGADYTATAYFSSAREGKSTPGDFWPPIRGLYRCDTYIISSYEVLSIRSRFSDYLYPHEVFDAPADWLIRMDNFLQRGYLPSLVFDAIKTSFQ